MVLDVREAHRLRVLEGGRALRQAREEAHIEAVAFMDEAAALAERIVGVIAGLPVPSAFAMNELGRLAFKARAAREELLRLSGTEPEPAA